MSTVLLFAILGAGTGAAYALVSMGIVLVYRGSGVLNFAGGAMGMVGTFAYWQLHDRNGVPLVLAMIAGLALSGLTGYLAYLLTRPLANASQLIRVVLTLALLVVLQGLAGLHWRADANYAAEAFLPQHSVKLAGFGVGIDRFIVIGAAFLLTGIVWAVYKFTRFGLATTAVSENADALATVGWSPNLVASVNWVLGAMLSCFSGILLAPTLGVSIGLATSLLLPAIAAAVIANLSSFPLTLAGGLLIGILQAELQRYVHLGGLGSGIGQIVPFVVIMLVVVARGRGLPLRSFLQERLPRVTSGDIPWRRSAVYLTVGVVVLLILPTDWVQSLTAFITAAVALLSVVVVTGLGGQISLAQWALAGLGAVGAAQLISHGVPTLLAIVLGALAVLPMGAIIGAAALRARGMSLAIATLAFNVCIVTLLPSYLRATGGFGLVGGVNLFGFSLDATLNPRRYAIFTLVVFGLLCLGILNLRRGRAGRRLLAVRANERAATALGISVRGAKLAAFCFGSVVAGLGGILTMMMFPFAQLSQFDSFTSIQLVSNSVLGGVGFVLGPLVGALGQPGGPMTKIFNYIPGSSHTPVTLVFGVLTLLIVTLAPDGFMPLQYKLRRRIVRLIRQSLRQPARAPRFADPAEFLASHREIDGVESRDDSVAARQPVELAITDATVVFGVVTAVETVSFTLRSGTILGIIGPNGAGKTTLIDAITGFVPLRGGSMRLDGREIAQASPKQRARLGLARSFQSLELFEDMTVLENLLAASDRRDWWAWLRDVVHPGSRKLTRTATLAVQELGLTDSLLKLPGELSYGTRRLVAIARAVASGPKILLLDEPAAGLDEQQRVELAAVVRRLAHEWNLAVLLIEHDVALVSSLSDEMLALDFGQTVAFGSPEDVRQHPGVVAAYLGGSVDAEPAGV
ncbi:MAG: transporter related protein [Frankiales bacterium]|nr:transporter related protein [Frankiales bacterium]